MMNGVLSKDPSRKEGGNQDQEKVVGEGGDRMEIDSRSHARGQTEEMIREQHRKVQETTRGLWSKAGT